MQYELDELQRAGVTPTVDLDLLRNGVLSLTFSWLLDTETTLLLRAVYPDEFPHLRPHVFLLSGLNPLPVRHINPLIGGLCLLGRDTRQWMPSWSLRRLLAEQLQSALRDEGVEDPQGEPADYWWNTLGLPGAYCLIDSDWTVPDAEEGTLRIQYVYGGSQETAAGPVPVIRAVVSEVRDKEDRVLHQWDGPLPHDVAAGKTLRDIPWVRLNRTILPQRDFGRQLEEMMQASPWLRRSRPAGLGDHFSAAYHVVIQPVEVGFGRIGLGWIMFQVSGARRAFDGRGRLTPCTVPVLRAGSADIGYRVPAVQHLRNKRLLVVGTGALGAPVAVELARNGCRYLDLLDQDRVEPGNSIRWPLGTSAWGYPKALALKEFLSREYPSTEVQEHVVMLGLAEGKPTGNGELLQDLVGKADLVIDASASQGVTRLVDAECRRAGVPLVSLFGTPSLEGGLVARYVGAGGCPNCLEFAFDRGLIPPPRGWEGEGSLVQPPGCSELTFIGAGYDLQELSLQAVRLAIETLSATSDLDSCVQTLALTNETGNRCPPRWRVDPLPKHPECCGRSS